MSWWTDRQDKDIFVKKRKLEGRISRAYYKIEQLHSKFNLIKKDMFILDLGAAPGGWSQFFIQFTKNLWAVDILNTFQVKNVKFLCADIFDDCIINGLPEFDVIASDMAPNMSGNRFIDQMKSVRLCERVLQISHSRLKHNGSIIMKIFDGQDLDILIKQCKIQFKTVDICKPEASRHDSNELFIIGRQKI
jgi:23S rRNA (uridine2552-2'-O)-methyltransferase